MGVSFVDYSITKIKFTIENEDMNIASWDDDTW